MTRIPALLLLLCVLAPPARAETVVPRTVVALFDERGSGIHRTMLHMLAELPLNHLGLVLEYHDVNAPLPEIAGRADVRGVITWFPSDTRLADPRAYLRWAEQALDGGKKYVMLGNPGFLRDREGHAPGAAADRFLQRIGLRMARRWQEVTLDVEYRVHTPEMFLSPDPYRWERPSFEVMSATPDAAVHLSAHGGTPAAEGALIVTGPRGSYAAENILHRAHERAGEEISQWRIDPFLFFRLAFATDDVPAPDTTTLAGRRIYYSHIDGDGWNNVTQVGEYRARPTLSAQVILEKAVHAYPDLPVTLTLIAADIDSEWVARSHSRDIAQAFLAEPQVEAGSHTYSHPFYWQFFMDGDWRKELPYLKHYPDRSWGVDAQATNEGAGPSHTHASLSSILMRDAHASEGGEGAAGVDALPGGYTVPRAYARKHFDIHREIRGSLDAIAPLLPEGKKMELLTWSGNCSPWEEAVRLTREAGVQNINGGDSRFDGEYPSLASLAPVGRQVGAERQIYASMSNENTYTNLWSENFHGFRHLVETLHRTETPIRLKPLNVYYHIYSGEKQASLNALLANLEYARAQPVAPVTASHYSRVAQGFFTARLTALGNDSWRIDDRGALETLRFDRHALSSVDFARSRGVVGQRHAQGSLYVALDAAEETPVIALKPYTAIHAPPIGNVPYLFESRWPVSHLKREKNTVEFTAGGFGAGEMTWIMPAPGRYGVRVDGVEHAVIATDGNVLTFTLPAGIGPRRVSIGPAGGHHA